MQKLQSYACFQLTLDCSEMRSLIFFTLLIAHSFSATKSDDIHELISNLHQIIQNQSSTFNEEIQFLKEENSAKEFRIQRLEEKSQVQQEVIEKLSLENEILKKQINETIVNVHEQGDQINKDEFNDIQSMYDKNTLTTQSYRK